MKTALVVILGMLMAGSIFVLYYMVLFGDFEDFSSRLSLVEQRLDSIIKVRKPELPSFEAGSGAEEVATVGLNAAQKQAITDEVLVMTKSEIEDLVSERVAFELSQQETPAPKPSVQVKEIFIPFGQASVKSDNNNWRDTGLEVQIDTGNYSAIKEVRFEGTLRVPTGNGMVEARMISGNGVVVGGSTISSGSVNGEYKQSGPIGLFGGKNSYKVQMRTSLNYEGYMDGGRVKIIVE